MHRIIFTFLFSIFLFGHAYTQDLTDKEYKLIEAAEKGQTSKLLELLNDSINPNLTDWYGMGPIHYATQNGHVKTVKALILNGADVDKTDYDLRTPLHLAVHFEQLDIAEYLLQQGADINSTDNYGLSPLFYASAYGDFIMNDMFLFYSDGEKLKDPEGRSQFLVAVLGGHLEVSSLLLKYFPEIDEKDNQGNNAIHLAVLNNDVEMIDSLNSWGCNISETNKKDYSCLDLAIQENQTESVQKLISLGADVNHTIQKGVNSMDLVLSHNQNPDIKELMEAAGAKRNNRISFSQPAIRLSVNTSFQDAFSNLKMEIWEPKYGFGFSLGASQRLGRLKVLSPPEENIRYQFRETRTGILAGVHKQWLLIRFNRYRRIGLHTGFDMGLYFGQNKGSKKGPDKIWAPMPTFGLYWQSGSWQLGFMSYYQNMKTFQLSPLRMGLSVAYRFNELK